MKRKKMMELFEFDLVFSLPEGSTHDAFALADCIYAAGFDDAVIGTGQPGLLAASLECAGEDAETVIRQVARAILPHLPAGSWLREVRPDLVSLADVAGRLQIKRQSLQKRPMPQPVTHGLYRVTEIFGVLTQQLNEKPSVRFDIDNAKPWFAAGKGAQRLNARLALGDLDAASLDIATA
jgi:hypothetical protein